MMVRNIVITLAYHDVDVHRAIANCRNWFCLRLKHDDKMWEYYIATIFVNLFQADEIKMHLGATENSIRYAIKYSTATPTPMAMAKAKAKATTKNIENMK